MPQNGRYVVLTGEYQIHNTGGGQQPRPDGDTVKFVVDSPGVVKSLPRFGGIPPKIGKNGGISLRLEAIDALETHYPTDQGRGPMVHQSLNLAFEARNALLENLGFTNLEFNDDSTVKSASAFTLDGYILANGVEKFGRVVGFAFAGNHPPEPDGERVWLKSEMMDSSANIKLLNQGLAYATLYQTLPIELIEHARKLARDARNNGLGVFGAEDIGASKSSMVDGLSTLQGLVMLPKLFRRLADFFVTTEGTLSEFDSWVREDKNRDDVIIQPSGEVGNLHDMYEITGDQIKLNFDPENMQVME